MEPMQEAFALTKGDSSVTSADGGTSASVYQDIWSYQVPVGIGHIILPGHTLGMYLYTNNSAEAVATHLVKVVVRDASKQDEKAILGPIMYATLKELVDRDKIARFNVASPVKVYERQYIVIQATGDGTYYIDVTGGTNESYFEMMISRVRQPL